MPPDDSCNMLWGARATNFLPQRFISKAFTFSLGIPRVSYTAVGYTFVIYRISQGQLSIDDIETLFKIKRIGWAA